MRALRTGALCSTGALAIACLLGTSPSTSYAAASTASDPSVSPTTNESEASQFGRLASLSRRGRGGRGGAGLSPGGNIGNFRNIRQLRRLLRQMFKRPRRPALLAPEGDIAKAQEAPIFYWTQVRYGIAYRFQLKSQSGERLIDGWLPTFAVCEQGICAFQPDIELPEGQYKWRVRARNVFRQGRWARRLKFRVGAPVDPPPPTTAISPVGDIDQTKPPYTWMAVQAATHYALTLYDAAGAPIYRGRYTAAEAQCTATCTYTPDFILAAASYSFTVTTENAAGFGKASPALKFNVKVNAIEAPTLISPTGDVPNTKPNYQWTGVLGSASYTLVVLDANNGERVNLPFEPALSCKDVGGARVCDATPDVELLLGSHTFTVKASDAAGNEATSLPLGFNVVAPLNAPVGISPTGATGSATPPFNWTYVTGALSYQLTVNDTDQNTIVFQGSFDPTQAACTAQACTVAVPQSLPNGNYNFTVTATDAANRTATSDPLVFNILVAVTPPVMTRPTGPQNVKTPTYEWAAHPQAGTYRVDVFQGGAAVLQLPFTPTDAGCAAAAVCSVMPNNPLLAGDYTAQVVLLPSPTVEIRSNVLSFSIVDNGVTITAPTGQANVTTPTYEWSANAAAVTYEIVVLNDPVQATPPFPTVVVNPVDAGCGAGGAAVCSIAPPNPLLAGNYTARIDLVDAAGVKFPSNTIPFGVVDNTLTITAPTGQANVTTPTYEWSVNTAAVSYEIVVLNDPPQATPPFPPVVVLPDAAGCGVGGAAVCSIAPPNPLLAGNYTARIDLVDANGDKFPSNTLPFGVADDAFTMVGPSGTVNTANPRYQWNYNASAVNYRVEIREAGVLVFDPAPEVLPADAQCVAAGTVCTFIPPNQQLTDAVTYTVQIFAIDAGAVDTPSDTLTFNIALVNAAIRVDSHNDNDSVLANGVILTGDVDAGVTDVTAELIISGAGFIARPVELSTARRWALFLTPAQLGAGGNAVVNLTTDDGAQTTLLTLNLNVLPFDVKAANLLRRATYGATPALLQELQVNGTTMLQQRLLDASADATGFNATLAGLPIGSRNEMQAYALIAAVNNPNPLQEIMTQFWDNHFSTDYDSHDVESWEIAENNGFRTNALGNFRQMLELSFRSPAMLVYLDQTESTANDPNENYARELLELHTLSVNGSYRAEDIEALARILTGWKEQSGAAVFDPSDHDTGTKTFMGMQILNNNAQEALDVLDFLAAHSETAQFICRKLSMVFVSEQPSQSLIDGCATVFQGGVASSTQVKDTLAFIFDSPDFADGANFGAKTKTPLEVLGSAIHNLQFQVADDQDMRGEIQQMSMDLFRKNTPDGWSEEAVDWISTESMLDRMRFVNEIAREGDNREIWQDWVGFYTTNGVETTEGIVGLLFSLALSNEFTDVELQTAWNILSNNGTEVFDITAADSEARLSRLAATVLSFPGFQHQ